MASLPLAAFKLVSSPEPNQIARGFGAASVLMVIVLVLFALARILGGRPAGRLTPRQARRRMAQSAGDLDRIESARLVRQSNHAGTSSPAASADAFTPEVTT
jgi:phosphate transport system permease protein